MPKLQAQRDPEPEPFDPYNHRQSCPLHSVQDCLTCHEVRGECSWGGCTRGALLAVMRYNGAGKPVERRLACACHTSVITGGSSEGSRIVPLTPEEYAAADLLRQEERSGASGVAK
jgi:hypothetical protein